MIRDKTFCKVTQPLLIHFFHISLLLQEEFSTKEKASLNYTISGQLESNKPTGPNKANLEMQLQLQLLKDENKILLHFLKLLLNTNI